MSRQPKNNNEGGDNLQQSPSSSSSAPFQSRSTTRNNNNNNTANNTNKTVTYYQPSVHQFTCRGAFHLQPDSSNTNTNTNSNSTSSERASPPINNTKDLQNIIKDTFICNGIQSKLRHVSDYPLAPSKEVAIHWFEGSGTNIGNNNPNASIAGVGQHNIGSAMQPVDSSQQHANNKENTKEGTDESNTDVMESVEVEPDSTFSSFGTTQVNILTIKEIPVQLPKHLQDVNNTNSPSSLVNDPFGGFGSIGSDRGRPMGGMLNPFGSLFGDFFGSGGGIDPWSSGQSLDENEQQQEQDEGSDISDNRRRNPWMMNKGSSSRSVSSSTRMERDEEGKRVVKTIQTTTIINNGKKSTEVVTTERHVDDGGRVETKKVVMSDDNNDGDSSGEKKKKRPGQDHPRVDRKKRPDWPTERVTPSGLAASVPAKALVGATYAQDHAPSSAPAEVAVIATDCLLGVSISDSASEDPDSAIPQSKKNKSKSSMKKNDKSGWRKTEYLFKLGRFIPPFMLVAKYYKDEEEEQRRRTEMQKEYNELTNKLKKNRWDKSSERDTNKDDDTDKTKPKLDYEMEDNAKTTQVTNDAKTTQVSDMSLRTQYYMQRIYVQMIKNVEMMEHLATNVIFKEDFPKKVHVQGTKIYNEITPTAERTGELMQKVWDMWIGYASGKSGGGWSSSGGGDK